MAGKKRGSADFPNITRSDFAKILEKARNIRYVRCPYLSMRDASLIAFEFLFKTRVSEGVGGVFPENRKDRHRSRFLDNYEGVRLNDFEVANGEKTRGSTLSFQSVEAWFLPFLLCKRLYTGGTMPFEYVHRAESRKLEREEEADKMWA